MMFVWTHPHEHLLIVCFTILHLFWNCSSGLGRSSKWTFCVHIFGNNRRFLVTDPMLLLRSLFFFSGVPNIGNVTRRSVDNWSQNDEKTFALEEVRKAWYIHETLGSHCDCYAGAEQKIGWLKIGWKTALLGVGSIPQYFDYWCDGFGDATFFSRSVQSLRNPNYVL